MTFGAFTGCVIRLLLNSYFQLPLSICTAVACVILFAALDKLKINFPPAGAILLIPMILDENLLIRFPIEVFIGAVVLCIASLLLFREDK